MEMGNKENPEGGKRECEIGGRVGRKDRKTQRKQGI